MGICLPTDLEPFVVNSPVAFRGAKLPICCHLDPPHSGLAASACSTGNGPRHETNPGMQTSSHPYHPRPIRSRLPEADVLGWANMSTMGLREYANVQCFKSQWVYPPLLSYSDTKSQIFGHCPLQTLVLALETIFRKIMTALAQTQKHRKLMS